VSLWNSGKVATEERKRKESGFCIERVFPQVLKSHTDRLLSFLHEETCYSKVVHPTTSIIVGNCGVIELTDDHTYRNEYIA